MTLYAYHQCIKYTPWTIENFNEISNQETAIERWQHFLTNAPTHVLDAIKFNTELSKQLKEARNEVVDDTEQDNNLLRDNWMILAEIRPSDDEFDDDERDK